MAKVCPKCRAEYSAEDVFCEDDGARLVDASVLQANRESLEPPTTQSPSIHDAETPLAPAVALRDCPSCGVTDADGGDGYCKACGHRLALRPPPAPNQGVRSASRPTPPLIPVGAKIGGCEIAGTRGGDDFIARAENGAIVTVTVGDSALLSEESSAIEALAKAGGDGERRVPRVVEQGVDASYGAYLVLTAPPSGARPLAEEGPAMRLDAALRYVDGLLDLAEAVERAGRGWASDRADLYVATDGQPVIARLRAQPKKGRLDARSLVETAGSAFTPYPAVTGSARLVRALLPHRAVSDEKRSVADVRTELAAARNAEQGEAKDARLGGVCDVGMRRDHNEDAMALASGETKGERWAVMVVCDGVSSSTHAEQASTMAAKTACDALTHFARSGDIAYEAASSAMSAAIRAAHLAVCAQGIEHGVLDPPGTTIVAGLVYRRRLTVGWVGDSRAYWITPHGAELLSRDHSWANEAVERGEMTEEEAMLAPLAHALTRCLGPLEVGEDATRIPEVEPEVRARDLPGPGHVVLCTDGMWNYFPAAADLAALVRITGPRATPAELAKTLLNHALVKGGMDNTTVAIYAFG